MNRMRTARCLVLTATLLRFGLVNTAVSQVGKSMGVVNPNLAGEEQLVVLPHLDAQLVKGIMDKRPFLSMSELHAFLSQSLDGESLKELYEKLFVPINLNTATREEILLIPGVGNRLAHEFEEYRPYRRLAQFRREIGKYVEDEELAHFEQFVFVPIDLNTASDEDILSIPGVGPKLLHEFKEYRPYKSVKQFRREIGKYLSEKEVARVERYVTVTAGDISEK